jgi:hypothetical protein
MTVFRANRFVPPPIIAEEVSEPAISRIERMLEKRQIPGGEIRSARICLPWVLFTQLRQQDGENQRARVVVGGVALGSIGDGEDRVLQHSRVIGQRVHVSEF